MKTIKAINTQIIIWSYIINPGPMLIGFGMFSLTTIDDPLISFINTESRAYLMISIGVILIIINGLKVRSLSNEKKKIIGNT